MTTRVFPPPRWIMDANSLLSLPHEGSTRAARLLQASRALAKKNFVAYGFLLVHVLPPREVPTALGATGAGAYKGSARLIRQFRV